MEESVKDRDDRDNRLIAEARHIQRQNDLKDWLAWLAKIRNMNYSSVIKDYNEKIKAIETKIKQLKKELER